MLNRRQILKGAALFSLAPTIPVFMESAGAAEKSNDRILVVIQLSGGNDGLNTIVPWKNEAYAANRRELRLKEESLIRIDDETAFHPSMGSMAELLQDGRLAIVQGVGYPNPNRSHEASMAIWHTAKTDVDEHRSDGWLGQALDTFAPQSRGPTGVSVSDEVIPAALRSHRTMVASIDSLQDFQVKSFPTQRASSSINGSNSSPLAEFMERTTLDAYATASQIDSLMTQSASNGVSELSMLDGPLARRLKIVSDLIRADFGPRVYYTQQSGYDTHAGQLNTHSQLLGSLSNGLKAFMDDIEAAGNADRVAVLCFSEFGRQVAENSSAGTDHGTAGPVFLAGKSFQSGLHGRPVDLSQLDQNAPSHTVDFRSIYVEILREWLQVKPDVKLGPFENKLSLFRG